MSGRLATSGSERRSFAFLVERLLPMHALEPGRVSRLRGAAAAGDLETLRHESQQAMADLTAAGLYEEQPSPDPNSRLYVGPFGGPRLVLESGHMTIQQASRPAPPADSQTVAQETLSTQARAASRVISSQAVKSEAIKGDPEVQARPEPAPDMGMSFKAIEPLLDLASIEPQLEPYGDRLRRVVAQLEQSLPGAQVKLLCLDPDAADAIGNGAVEILDRAAIEEVPHYREALRLGETQFATSAPVGADPASGRIAAAVPVYVAGDPWGLLRVTWDQGSVDSVPDLARLLAPLSRLVAIAIQNQTMLEKLVFLDPLTGVYNRAFYDRQVALEIERANRTNQKFALLVMDVDDFKRINDQHGHRAGDQVLAQLAREVRGRMRKIDLMFRYGGEEFVLLLPGADLEEAGRTGERLRLVVSEQRFLPEGVVAPLRVSVSVGGAVYPDQSRTKTGIFNAADAALYRAKHEGKNRVCF